MKISFSKTSVLLSTLMTSLLLGTAHYSFATMAPMPDLLSNLPKELQTEIEKYKERKYVKASDLTEDNVERYKEYDALGLDLDRFDDKTMKLVSKLTNLKAISLHAPGSGRGSIGVLITDNVLTYLKDLKNLKSIVLISGRITDAGLANLKDLTNLEFINLNDTPITDVGLAHLKNLTNLKTIFLISTKVTDAGLAFLENLKKLEFIDLYDTSITDAGLAHLKNLTNLKKITVGYKVTKPGEDEFRKSLPKVIVGR